MKIIYSEDLRQILKNIDFDTITDNADSYFIVDDSPINHFEEGFDLCNKARDTNQNVYATIINGCGIFILGNDESEVLNKISTWKR